MWPRFPRESPAAVQYGNSVKVNSVYNVRNTS